ncbi:hypothetical protein Pint_25493 [Pistacia integerrima]|uniref:Uncharacterized protein n=1 Tax=Pistacia integerrima TaxID=434235 RepID=A0ACC0YBG0_9ROSI|nr:hypothetical protein Pint_25493 [Pistacia integerrima]
MHTGNQAVNDKNFLLQLTEARLPSSVMHQGTLKQEFRSVPRRPMGMGGTTSPISLGLSFGFQPLV